MALDLGRGVGQETATGLLLIIKIGLTIELTGVFKIEQTQCPGWPKTTAGLRCPVGIRSERS
jgi:hypothetical protein